MKKLIPIIVVLIGAASGGALGLYLKPAALQSNTSELARLNDGGAAPIESKDESPAKKNAKKEEEIGGDREYVKIGRQIIIPIVSGGETKALMLFELAVDVPLGQRQLVVEKEPRLRDAFLRELFKMSYTGAFMTTFTDDRIIEELRRNLIAAAQDHVGDIVDDVLILDVMRQEVG